MVMGLAAVIALPGPPAPCLSLPGRAGSAGNPSLEQVPGSLAGPFANEACYSAQRCADYIRDSPDFLPG